MRPHPTDERPVSRDSRPCTRCGVAMEFTATTTRDDVSSEVWTCPSCGARLHANFREAWARVTPA